MNKNKWIKNILLVEPNYYSRYPPLSLLKLSAYHKARGDIVQLVRGIQPITIAPNKIYISSLFTYAWKPVHDAIGFYINRFPRADTVVGGIYATLCADHLENAFKDKIRIRRGLFEQIDKLMPDYSLVPGWERSIVFSSRGCIRDCPFCSVKALEPEFKAHKSIKHLIYPRHKGIIFWDNNFLGSPFCNNIFNELLSLDLEVDFNQGLDARLITEEVAIWLKRLRIQLVRLAYDTLTIRNKLSKAVKMLKDVGFRGRSIIVYCLYNFQDSPEDFLSRVKELMELGVAVYPMRFEPLKPNKKNTFIYKTWTPEYLEMIADARRVIGFGGAFPPYEALRKKIGNAKRFGDAFKLRPIRES